MKYWVYLNGEVPGSYEPEDLAAIPGFTETSLVCPATDQLADRRWERAGAFPDIADALKARQKPPLAPVEPPPVRLAGAPRVVTPDEILSDSSQRLFRHVSELMKELENRREERALTQSLQRRVAELTTELGALRERASYLQGRADLLPGFQDREKELSETLARAKADLHETRQGAARLDADLGATQASLATTRRALEQAKSDGAEREKRLAELTQSLAEKEATLAKSFGVVRRLEEMLGQLLPDPAGPPAPAPAPAEPASPRPEVAALEPDTAFPPPPPADAPPVVPEIPDEDVSPFQPPWKSKLASFLSSWRGKSDK